MNCDRHQSISKLCSTYLNQYCSYSIGKIANFNTAALLVATSGFLTLGTSSAIAQSTAPTTTSCPAGSVLSEQTLLNFQDPTPEPGTTNGDYSLGAVYRFSNVATNTDAIVEVVALNGASVSRFDVGGTTGIASAFQPEIASNSTAAGEYSADFQIRFVQSGTTTPRVLNNVLSTGVDIDGDNTVVREFVQFDGITLDTYTIENPSSLTVNQANSQTVRFESQTTTVNPGINLNTANMGSAEYATVEVFNYRAGLIIGDNAPTNIANQRLNSLYFECVQYNNPNTNPGLTPLDYSDAPANGGTAPNGSGTTGYGEASHVIVSGTRLGDNIDEEAAAQSSPNADGDGTDDDGVTIPFLTTGETATITADVSGAGGYLQGWIDWDGDGSFDAGEQVATDIQDNGAGDDDNTAGKISFDVNVPVTAIITADTFARFRWSTTQGLDTTTSAGDGEVEDYPVTISVPIYDYGDAPDTGTGTGTGNYQTTAIDDGAAQVVINAGNQILSIGDTVDTDDGSLQNADATADDTLDSVDDEDGITTLPTLTDEEGQTYTISVPVRNSVPLVDAYLVGYIDFNQDGDFDDLNEQSDTATITPNTTGDAQTVDLTFTTPAGMTPGNTFVRLRLGQIQATAEQATGAAASTDNGEIEDHQIAIAQSTASTTTSCPAGSVLPEQTLLNFQDPTPEPGTTNGDYSLGAVYRFSNVATNTDAIVEVVALNGASVSRFDVGGTTGIASAFQPEIASNSTAAGEYSADFQIRFVQSGTTTPQVLNNVLSTGVDIDGDNTVVREFVQFDGVTLDTYTIETPSSLTVTQANSQTVRFESQTTTVNPGINLNTANMGSAEYATVEVFNYRAGLIIGDNAPTNIANQRLNSLYFECVQYNNPNTNPGLTPLDYSDAPANGGTAPNGSGTTGYGEASHVIVSGTRLGDNIDEEAAAQSSPAADGDGTDDDGVTIPFLTTGETATITADVSGAGGYLQGWIDWDGDGSFDAGEQVATDIQDNGAGDDDNTAGKISFDVNVPVTAIITADTFARFRWSTTQGLNTTTSAGDGEVEDYQLAIASTPSEPQPATSCPAGLGGVYATWSKDANENSGTGVFNPTSPGVASAPNFSWTATGDVRSTEIDSSETFANNNQFEDIYGQADSASNLNARVSNPDSVADEGAPITQSSTITLTFDRPTPSVGFGISIIDIESNQVRFRAKDADGNDVPVATIAEWFVEAFDANPGNDDNTPSWDPAEAALIGDESPTPVWQTTVVNNVGDSEAGAGWLQPDIPLSELTIEDQSLYRETGAGPSMHIYMASCLEQASDPGLLLVKRITAINPDRGQPKEIQFDDFVDDPNTTDDNHPRWPDPDGDPSNNTNPYLRGVLDGGRIKPGDEVEYTIYFLSNGDEDARDVNICDVVPDHLTYVKNAYGSEIGIGLGYDPADLQTSPNKFLSNLLDSDEGDFYGAGTTPPANQCKKVDSGNNLVTVDGSNNNNGAIIVQPASLLPPATSPGQPAGSYGFIRFRGRVK